VHGIDIKPAFIANPMYVHHVADIRKKDALPDIEDVSVLFNNAGVQQGPVDIATNLIGAINVTEKYIDGNHALRSILFNASASSVSGQEFPHYVASKAGLVGYMRNVAIRVAPRRVTCNAISLGGVLTDSNDSVMGNPKLWQAIMKVTPMKKWTTLEEVCEWIAFLTLTNRSMSGQNLLIDNGEMHLNPTFVWPGFGGGDH
jgi:3-oxoacyl-[acyl-carrier protein] reductase